MSEKTRIRGGRAVYWIMDFLLPIVIFFLLLKWNNVYPLGSTTFLTEDLRFQYIDFYSWLLSVIHGEASLLYIPNQGLGSNAWGLVGYYLSSPFNLLIVFFNENNLTDFAVLITALKLGCIQVSMTWYLRNRFKIRLRYVTFLALCFTWSCWTATQLRNPLWLDALILLPLASYGVYLLVTEKKVGLVIAAVTLSIITCWYTAYMIIVFLLLYTIVEMIAFASEKSGISISDIVKKWLLLGASFALSLLLSAFTFLPTIMAMLGNTSVGVSSVPEGFLCSPLNLLSSFFVGGWTYDKSPQLFIGSACVFLLILFVATKSIPLRVKVAGLLCALLIVASSYVFILYCFWNGLRPPNGFYCRITYLWAFMAIWCCAYVMRQHQGSKIERKEIGWSAFCSVVFVLEIWFLGGFSKPLHAVVSIASVLLFALAFLFMLLERRCVNQKMKTVASVVLLAVVSVELSYGAHLDWKMIYNIENQTVYDNYIAATKSMLGQLNAKDDSIYRTERTFTRAEPAALNDGMAHGYLQLSSYSSAHNAAAINFLNAIGYSNESEVSVRYSSPNLLMDSLLGVKYVSDFKQPAGYADTGLVREDNGAGCFLNPTALPLAYKVSANAVNATLPLDKNVFERQNSFVSALLGKTLDCYKPAEKELTRKQKADRSFELRYPEGGIGYIYIVGATHPIWFTIDNGKPIQENWRFQHAVIPVTDLLDESQTVDVQLMSSAKKGKGKKFAKDVDCVAYYLDVDNFNTTINELRKGSCQISRWSGGTISCECDSEESGYVMLTLPRDSGWKAEVNGASVELESMCNGALTIVPIQPGENRIELSYTPPGLIVGIVITVATLVMMAIVLMLRRVKGLARSRSGVQFKQH